ncbi:MAG: transposase, partial [Symbiobacteriaceae bacterium]|nr:transposase [Symbiobacteriaceae bacterium]
MGKRGPELNTTGADPVFKPTGYPSDLSDDEWDVIKDFFPQGPNSTHHKRALVNAVLYLLDNGCKWRGLPHDYPPYSTVHSFFRRARISGLWDKVHRDIVMKTRRKAGRADTPSYA